MENEKKKKLILGLILKCLNGESENNITINELSIKTEEDKLNFRCDVEGNLNNETLEKIVNALM